MTTDNKIRVMWKYITYMKMTERVAKLSYDPKHQVGSMIVKKDFSDIASSGYNGNYSGGENKRDSDESGMSGFLHAEENAIIKANLDHPENYISFVTMTPCVMCAKRIANKGIKQVVYLDDYPNSTGSAEVFKRSGIAFHSLNEKLCELYITTDLAQAYIPQRERWESMKMIDVATEMKSLLYVQINTMFEMDPQATMRIPAFEIPVSEHDTAYKLFHTYIRVFCKIAYDLA